MPKSKCYHGSANFHLRLFKIFGVLIFVDSINHENVYSEYFVTAYTVHKLVVNHFDTTETTSRLGGFVQ